MRRKKAEQEYLSQPPREGEEYDDVKEAHFVREYCRVKNKQLMRAIGYF
eukprot:CAMPEP_0168317778 /NCGR_PEP_ID=MMETSP0213-20121227/91_1 /TAXON_ID=151035 /ORGANISM="Euplotes harpa, Strain FSP1.4" /LENGTH=48 /DNA_ID= /DNA_START= /DNA_END= /DNA_ORIENTATION=